MILPCIWIRKWSNSRRSSCGKARPPADKKVRLSTSPMFFCVGISHKVQYLQRRLECLHCRLQSLLLWTVSLEKVLQIFVATKSVCSTAFCLTLWTKNLVFTTSLGVECNNCTTITPLCRCTRGFSGLCWLQHLQCFSNMSTTNVDIFFHSITSPKR